MPGLSSRGMLVSEAARLCGVTPRAIRFYEDRGLIRSGRGRAGQRLFDAQALERLACIAEVRALGLSVAEARALLEVGDLHGPQAQRERMLELCRRRLKVIDAQRGLVEAALARLDGPQAGMRLAG